MGKVGPFFRGDIQIGLNFGHNQFDHFHIRVPHFCQSFQNFHNILKTHVSIVAEPKLNFLN